MFMGSNAALRTVNPRYRHAEIARLDDQIGPAPEES
jgi:hypothetical protein